MKLLMLTEALVCLLAAGLWAAPPKADAPKSTGNSSSAAKSSLNTPASNAPETERPRLLHNIELLIEDGIPAKEYAKQLDYFHIELGAEDANGDVQYASRLTSPKPERREGKRQDDSRVTIEWKRGGLMALDRKMLTKAGIKSQGKKILQFYPLEVEDQMMALERAYTGLPNPDVARTLFKIRAQESGPGYEFYIDNLDLVSDSPVKPTTSAGSQNLRGK